MIRTSAINLRPTSQMPHSTDSVHCIPTAAIQEATAFDIELADNPVFFSLARRNQVVGSNAGFIELFCRTQCGSAVEGRRYGVRERVESGITDIQ